jgi:hypothetical protein
VRLSTGGLWRSQMGASRCGAGIFAPSHQNDAGLLADPVLLQDGPERDALHLDSAGDGVIGGGAGNDAGAVGGVAVVEIAAV